MTAGYPYFRKPQNGEIQQKPSPSFAPLAHDSEVKAGMVVLATALAVAKAGAVARAGAAVLAIAVQEVCGTSFSAQQARAQDKSIDGDGSKPVEYIEIH